MKKLLLILGKPGCGKDTQIEFLKKRRKIDELSVGDLVRDYIAKNEAMKERVNQGNLADNSVVNSLFEQALNKFSGDNLILSNGFPRDLDQAQWFHEYLKNSPSILIEKVILLDISDEESISRLSKRGRDDDKIESVKNRLSVFKDKTQKVIDFYDHKGLLVKIDGMGTEEEIAQSLKESLGW